MKIISVVGARPNFMKVAPIHKAFEKRIANGGQRTVQHLICHTGQHYDEKMSKIFFEDLELPKPDFYLGVGSGSHAEQTAKVMIEFEKVLLQEKPDLIIVVGDVNSTIACSLVASKMGIKIAHVEAGLRSFDMDMPEEINRILTDRISDYLFVTEKSGLKNLKNEGVPEDKIFFVGNVMIDSLINYLPKANKFNINSKFNPPMADQNLPADRQGSKYILVTMHRPSNVDSPESLKRLMEMLNRLAEKRKVIFPVHPRTRNNLNSKDMLSNVKDSSVEDSLRMTEEYSKEIPGQARNANLIVTDPVGYIDFLALTKNAELIITDSGGIQEEATFLGVQCITVRDNTERPITVEEGTNQLIGTDFVKVEKAAMEVLKGNKKEGKIPELWDGKAADRIVEVLLNGNTCNNME